jgi:uncharacterized repeat protein (TIGR04042 family)
MPEVRFRVRWPDDSVTECYSPSREIGASLSVGTPYPPAEFARRCREGLERGSERVRMKYGYGCGHAALQAEEIDRLAARFADWPEARVLVEAFLT